MGREIKRVPLDFDHPVGEVWPGYVNPHWKDCPNCRGRGTTKAREHLDQCVQTLIWRIDRLHGDDYAEIAQLTTGLCGRSPMGRIIGHDAIDRWHAISTIITAAGLDPKTWGYCPVCKGEGIAPEKQADWEAWEKTEPPKGEGWQIWENVTEGSPISPVFATAEKAVNWLVEQGYRPEAAQAFVKRDGYVPSMVMVDGRVYQDIEAASIPSHCGEPEVG